MKEEKTISIEKTKTETKKIEEKPKTEEETKNIVSGRTPKKGFKLYTISANVKLKDNRFFIQKVVEAKTEKHANIEYDKMVKKEYGKPKSITKRTFKTYENGDEDICNTIVDEPKRVIQDSPELIEFNKKLEVLESDRKSVV